MLNDFKEEFAKQVLEDLQKLLKPKPKLKVKRVLCDSDASYYEDRNWDPQNLSLPPPRC